MSNLRIGIGYDVHRLESNLPFVIGGVKLNHHKGIVAHSDGDIIYHTIADALLGAAALGDIGHLFPDTDLKNKDLDSSVILSTVIDELQKKSYSIVNIDVSLVLERPKIQPYMLQIRESISQLMKLDLDVVSVKATTTEKMSFIGLEQGLSCYSVVLIEKK